MERHDLLASIWYEKLESRRLASQILSTVVWRVCKLTHFQYRNSVATSMVRLSKRGARLTVCVQPSLQAWSSGRLSKN
jgi:hypothetical protein